MKWNEAIELDHYQYGGLRIYPYQLAFGISVSWWPCVMFKIYCGPFRLLVRISKCWE